MLPPRDFTRSDDLPRSREPIGHLEIAFTGDAGDKDHPLHDISACALAGSALFLAGDEARAIERVSPLAGGAFGHHRRFPLADLVDLGDAKGETDIEGLAVSGGWLWITGSHSRTRPDPRDDGEEPGRIDLDRLAELEDTRARCVLARIPLRTGADGLPEPVARDGKRHAGLVAQKKKHGSRLARLIAGDPLLGPATRLAAKEGGLDIEGVASHEGRLALGLRGPVLRSFAVVLEPPVEAKKSGKLHLAGAPCTRLVDLDGLGIRDLRVKGRDLWILAGPTQDLDGRCAIFRWNGWADDPPEDARVVRLHEPDHVFDLPVRFRHDHPEGIDFWTDEGGREHLLVVYDSPSPLRLDIGRGTILADLFALA